MFRIKISAMLTLVVVAVVAVVYFVLPSMLDGELEGDAKSALSIASTSMERYERLNDFSVLARAQEVAAFYRLREALTGEYEDPYEYKRHMAVLDNGLLRWKHVYEDARKVGEGKSVVSMPLAARPPSMPDLFFVTDDKGVGVAACCDTAQREWYKENIARSQPIVMSVDDGKARKDIWFWRWDEADAGSYYQVGIAPVMQGPEKLLGMVVVGRNITNTNAKYASEQIGGHAVAYFHKKAIFASTFDKSVDAVLAEQIWGSGGLGEGGSPDAVAIQIGSQEYLAMVRYSNGNAGGSATDTGFVVLTNLTEARAVARSVERGILIVGLLILVLLLISVLIVIRSFVKPFEEIDQGIQEVIAGNKDYVFNVTGNYPFQDEMAQSLNLMTAYLQGKRMPDEEDENTENWGDFMVGEVTSTAMMRAMGRDGAPKVAGIPQNLTSTPATTEPVEEYKKRLFGEYVEAREGLGMDVKELTMENFEAKLSRHADSLKEKHKAREIRFSVVVRDGKVVLKPQPIF